MIKIASHCNRDLCHRLYKILENPPAQILIGRFVDGPQKWFQWKGSNQKRIEFGWTKEYFRLLGALKQQCEVTHFAVAMTYHNEVCEDVPLLCRTKYSARGLMHYAPGEPIQITPCAPGPGFDVAGKLQFCLDRWEEVKHCFHRGVYVLMGEDATEEESFQDTMFHYIGSEMTGTAARYGKGITKVEENFVTENREAIQLVKMFHS